LTRIWEHLWQEIAEKIAKGSKGLGFRKRKKNLKHRAAQFLLLRKRQQADSSE